MPQSFHDYIREYQDSHDCSDDDMLKILCETVETFLEDSPSVIARIKDFLPIEEEIE